MAKERKYEKEYQEYCNKLLEQLEKGGMNKLEVHLAKIRYKNSKTAYYDFVDLLESSKDKEINLEFIPERV